MGTRTAFEFRQCITLLKSTGRKARSLRELRDTIAVISDQSLFHHTSEYFLKGHVMEYTNDFAHWAGESIEERALAEHLSAIDPYALAGSEQLRAELLRVIDEYQGSFPEPREAMPHDEFFFNETIGIVFPTGVRARNLAEFFIALRHIDSNSLYYHYYDARRRLGNGQDDFSSWIMGSLGKEDLAGKIRAIDPFMHSVEGIRELIISAVSETVREDMEAAGVVE